MCVAPGRRHPDAAGVRRQDSFAVRLTSYGIWYPRARPTVRFHTAPHLPQTRLQESQKDGSTAAVIASRTRCASSGSGCTAFTLNRRPLPACIGAGEAGQIVVMADAGQVPQALREPTWHRSRPVCDARREARVGSSLTSWRPHGRAATSGPTCDTLPAAATEARR